MLNLPSNPGATSTSRNSRPFQHWLEGTEHRVTIPYAQQLAELVPPVAVRLRRDFGAVLALIRAHAVLHQLSRARDADGRIVATLDDYTAVAGLVADVLAEGVASTVSPVMREAVEAVADLTPDCDDGVKAADIAKALKIDKSAAWRRLRAAGDWDYIVNEETRRGRPGRWVIGESLPEDVPILPDPQALQPDNPDPPRNRWNHKGNRTVVARLHGLLRGERPPQPPTPVGRRAGLRGLLMLAPGDPLDVLDTLRTMGVTVTLDRPTGQLHARPRPLPALAVELIRANRPLVHAVLLGAHTGHVWSRCDRCGAGLMRPKRAKPRRCVFTPRCDGRHRNGKTR